MTDTKVRGHDLPPKWDGHRVEWHGWHAAPAMFICPPSAARPEPCPACGSMRERVMNRGAVWVKASDAVPQIRQGRLRAETVGGTLVAFRCAECRHDQVYDRTAGQWWDLDESDYGDEGSDD